MADDYMRSVTKGDRIRFRGDDGDMTGTACHVVNRDDHYVLMVDVGPDGVEELLEVSLSDVVSVIEPALSLVEEMEVLVKRLRHFEDVRQWQLVGSEMTQIEEAGLYLNSALESVRARLDAERR